MSQKRQAEIKAGLSQRSFNLQIAKAGDKRALVWQVDQLAERVATKPRAWRDKNTAKNLLMVC